MLQQTIGNPFRIAGTGIHSGAWAELTVLPQPPDSGIIMQRVDLAGQPKIRADFRSVISTGRCVAIGTGRWKIGTVEHLMAVFHGLGIDNALVQVNGAELPHCDGGGRDFAACIIESGIQEQTAERSYFTVTTPVWVQDSGSSLIALPGPHLEISYTYQCSFETQFFHFDITSQSFITEIAPARTIAYEEQIDAMRSQGLGLGGTIDSVVLLSKAGYRNKPKIAQEMARHKILDLIGDLYLIGQPVTGHFIGIRSGHSQNIELIRSMLKVHGL